MEKWTPKSKVGMDILDWLDFHQAEDSLKAFYRTLLLVRQDIIEPNAFLLYLTSEKLAKKHAVEFKQVHVVEPELRIERALQLAEKVGSTIEILAALEETGNEKFMEKVLHHLHYQAVRVSVASVPGPCEGEKTATATNTTGSIAPQAMAIANEQLPQELLLMEGSAQVRELQWTDQPRNSYLAGCLVIGNEIILAGMKDGSQSGGFIQVYDLHSFERKKDTPKEFPICWIQSIADILITSDCSRSVWIIKKSDLSLIQRQKLALNDEDEISALNCNGSSILAAYKSGVILRWSLEQPDNDAFTRTWNRRLGTARECSELYFDDSHVLCGDSTKVTLLSFIDEAVRRRTTGYPLGLCKGFAIIAEQERSVSVWCPVTWTRVRRFVSDWPMRYLACHEELVFVSDSTKNIGVVNWDTLLSSTEGSEQSILSQHLLSCYKDQHGGCILGLHVWGSGMICRHSNSSLCVWRIFDK